ncbi:hypothetical protein DL240_09460 [Lujinxingia litoralis]|uniref:Uncharacterized protein n=2 Tax=Lujinxingia litoralis TaxID=2211119 RepID=A0A328CC75_9DELT|nr:hypothetical protein DL240_09460 [Lujinxingia litoralis]
MLTHMMVLGAEWNAMYGAWVDHPRAIEESFGEMFYGLWSEGWFGVATRVLWCAGEMGEVLAPGLMARMEHEEHVSRGFFSAMALTVIALRHEQYFDPWIKLLKSWPPSGDDSSEKALTEVERMRSLCREELLPALEDPDSHRQRFCEMALEQYEGSFGDGDGEAEGWVAPEALNEDELCSLFHLMLFDDHGGGANLTMLVYALPYLAAISAEELYPRAEILPPGEGWAPGIGASLLAHMGRRLSYRKPERVSAVPGRNDPCGCGSGKKYKRCCAGMMVH